MAEGPRELVEALGWPSPGEDVVVRLTSGVVVRGTVYCWATSQFSMETDLYLQPLKGKRVKRKVPLVRDGLTMVRGRRIRSVRLSE